jgi:hypothetical protein
MAQRPESGLMARPGPSTHQDFVFFVLFVVRIPSPLARNFFYHKEHRDRQGLCVHVLYGWRSGLKAG